MVISAGVMQPRRLHLQAFDLFGKGSGNLLRQEAEGGMELPVVEHHFQRPFDLAGFLLNQGERHAHLVENGGLDAVVRAQGAVAVIRPTAGGKAAVGRQNGKGAKPYQTVGNVLDKGLDDRAGRGAIDPRGPDEGDARPLARCTDRRGTVLFAMACGITLDAAAQRQRCRLRSPALDAQLADKPARA